MEPVTYVASTTAADASVVPSFGFDIFAVIGGMFGGAGSLSGGGILGFFILF